MRKSLLVLAGVLLLGGIAAGCLGGCKNSAQASLDRTRRALRRAGFKMDLSEFNVPWPPGARARTAALDKAGAAGYLELAEAVDFLPPVGTNSALVMCDEREVLAASYHQPATNLWTALRAKLNHTALDSACAAALSGPYVGALEGTGGGRACRLPDPLAASILLALHEHDQGKAWTNLLALTCLLARWQPQPNEMEWFYWRNVNLVRVYGVTWQAVQARILTEPQMAALQHEWETADFRQGVPDIAARARAKIEHEFELESARKPDPFDPRVFLAPARAWPYLAERRKTLRYHNYGRYQDEEALLRLFRDCELDYRQVEACSTWAEIAAMRKLRGPPPGFTNLVISPTNLVMDMRWQTLSTISAFNSFAFGSRMSGLGRMAGSETMRRLLVAALAVERYRLRHGAYPDSPDALIPEVLARWPLDFMDGKPLRYRRGADGRFFLYSVGEGGGDDGGVSRTPGQLWANGPDMVWPRPGLPAEVAAEVAMRRAMSAAETASRTFVPLR